MLNLNQGGPNGPPKKERKLTFKALVDGYHVPRFPFWMYKDGAEPYKVENEQDIEDARSIGYDMLTAGDMANKYLINWYWDLEDMSPKQLCVFAKEEYGVALPIEAGQDRLFLAVVELTRHAPQNRNRLVLMAHTIEMEYDATLEEIKRAVSSPQKGYETETITMEFTA